MKVMCSRNTFSEYMIVRNIRVRDIVIADSLQRRFAQEGFLKLRNTSHHIKNRLSFDSGNSSAADMLQINDEGTDSGPDTFRFFSVKFSPQLRIIAKTNDTVFEA